MDQIILEGGIVLPETSRDKYSCYEEDLSVQVQMITGRVVLESRGTVWRVNYSYDYMGNDLMRQVLAVLRSGRPFLATVLPDKSDQPVTSSFILTQLSQPTFAFSRGGKPYWHNFAFSLREEEPHD